MVLMTYTPVIGLTLRFQISNVNQNQFLSNILAMPTKYFY